MKIQALSKNDTAIIKGVAILLILFHNFLHILTPCTGESEFYFNENVMFNLFNLIAQNPVEFPRFLLDALGFFGVQLFVFISGYGLARSFSKNPQSWGSFVVVRLKKLYPLLLTGITFLFAYKLIWNGFPNAKWFVDVLHKLLFVHTLLPYGNFSLVGPWWFFGLIFQLYLLFPFVYRAVQKYGVKAFAAISVVAYVLVYFCMYNGAEEVIHDIDLLANAPGHIAEFALGIYFALNHEKNFHWIWCVLATLIFCLGLFYEAFFPLTFLSFTVIAMFVLGKIRFHAPIEKFLVFIGGISMTIFATHCILRTIFNNINLFNLYESSLWHYFVSLLFLAGSVILAFVAKYVLNFFTKLFGKISAPNHRENTGWEKLAIAVFSLCYAWILFFYGQQFINQETSLEIPVTLESPTIQIEESDEFGNIAVCEIPQNIYFAKAEISFDVSNANGVPPLIIFDARPHSYERETFSASEADSATQITKSIRANCSIFNISKGDKFSLYFWNNKGWTGDISNIQVKILAKTIF